MKSVALIFPHQLFKENKILENIDTAYIVEEYLFFSQYNFHKQKLVLHRASMQFYAAYLAQKNIAVHYIDAQNENSDIRKLIPHLAAQNIGEIVYNDSTDYMLERRMKAAAAKNNISLQKYISPLFINSETDVTAFFVGKTKYFQTDFYIHQRKKLGILIEGKDKPVGGKWSYDADNRLKYPKDKTPPATTFPALNTHYKEAIHYVETNFKNNYGEANPHFIYPTNFEETDVWLQQFLQKRFSEFGEYEDAMVENEIILHHSILTPMLNIGLITPQEVINKTLLYAQENNISLNSTEGFVRQIIGWREFIRAIYQLKGTQERTTNYWKFTRKIPPSFWDGTTGIEPIDTVIKNVLKTGYCHHIERLMVLGNFMLLCEFDPNEVYRWFMEMFVDAYDWVMVTNVYGMSQFADGGLMATKPYISGSNYLMKMSNYKKGDWQPTWDGLFWRFMHTQRQFFLQNPRLGMLVHTFDKMDSSKRETHLKNAENFLEKLDI